MLGTTSSSRGLSSCITPAHGQCAQHAAGERDRERQVLTCALERVNVLRPGREVCHRLYELQARLLILLEHYHHKRGRHCNLPEKNEPLTLHDLPLRHRSALSCVCAHAVVTMATLRMLIRAE